MKKKQNPYNILITAGPTREFIDPVRFLTNASTGAIGYKLAERAKKEGNNVILLSGPTHLTIPKNTKTLYFNSALELETLVNKYFQWADCIISSAAVADFRPQKISAQKIKKHKGLLEIKLRRNPDILKNLGKRKGKKVLVGFSLETDNIIINSRKKLKEKNLDFIIANQLSKSSVPFGTGRVTAFVIDKKEVKKYVSLSKNMLSRIILDRVRKLCYILVNQKKRR